MRLSLIILAVALCGITSPILAKSDWDEGPPANSSKSAKKPLQGSVEENSVAPHYQSGQAQKADEGPLSGSAIDDELRGMVKDGSLKPLSGLTDSNNPLKGKAIKDGQNALQSLDPDADDQELMVEWDRWRNRFLRAVQLGVQEIVNNPEAEDYERPRVDPRTGQILPQYPLGTGTVFSCQIFSSGQIKNLEIIHSSGFPKYDKAVFRAVQQLEGTRVLVFPKNSRRKAVSQAAKIKTATSNDFNYYHFGDVEKVRSGGQ